MKSPDFNFKVKVEVFPSRVAWYYAMLPKKDSVSIERLFHDAKRGWNSLKVKVSLGTSQWETSIFFDRKKKQFMLPLKKEIREREGIVLGGNIKVMLEILL